ncbi:MAG: type II CAAX prenyl endopeptidase Rce1 family protein [Methanobacterium sp.]
MNSITNLIRNNQLISFFILAFILSWLVYLIPEFSSISLFGVALAAIIISAINKPQIIRKNYLKRWITFLITFIITLIALYVISPIYSLTIIEIIISSFIVAYIISGGLSNVKGVRELLSKLYIWRVNVKWYIFVIIIVPLIYFLISIIADLLSGQPVQFQYTVSGLIPFFIFTLFLNSFEEEIGWRGFALPHLQNHYSPLIASLILGVIWTIWHFPNYIPQLLSDGAIIFTILCLAKFLLIIPITFIYTWVYNHTRGSLLLVILLHAIGNFSVGLVLSPTLTSFTGLIIFDVINGVIFSIIAVTIIIKDKMWLKLPENSQAIYRETEVTQ